MEESNCQRGSLEAHRSQKRRLSWMKTLTADFVRCMLEEWRWQNFVPFKTPFETRRDLGFELEVPLDMEDRGMVELGMADVGMVDVPWQTWTWLLPWWSMLLDKTVDAKHH
jgi:hypothetical protein